MKSFAKFISTIGNPLSFGLLFGIYIQFFDKSATEYSFLPLIFTLTLIIPVAIFIYYNVKTGNFHDYDVSDKKKRNQLYRFVLLCLFVLLILLILGKYPIKAMLLVAVIFVQLAVSYFVNQKSKISLHVGFNFLFAFLFYPINSHLALGIFIFGFINLWSRLALRRHKPIEVALGFALACINGLMYLYILKLNA